MRWHLYVLHAAGPAATAATLRATGYLPTAHRVSVDDAIAEIDDLAPGGLALLDPPDGDTSEVGAPSVVAVARLVEHDELALALSAGGGTATSFQWHAATDTYVLTAFHDARPHRRRVQVEGEIVVAEGPELAIEAPLDWSDASSALLAAASALTGTPVGAPTWLAHPTVVHRRRRRAQDS